MHSEQIKYYMYLLVHIQLIFMVWQREYKCVNSLIVWKHERSRSQLYIHWTLERPKEFFKLQHDFDRNILFFSENTQQNMLWSTFDTKVKQADEKVQVC